MATDGIVPEAHLVCYSLRVLDGYTDLPPGKLANVVTYLEMRTPPAPQAAPTLSEYSVRRVAMPDLDWHRRLYREIGELWLWFSRLRLSDDELRAILHDPAVYPPPAVQARLYQSAEVAPALERLRTRTWTRVKTGL